MTHSNEIPATIEQLGMSTFAYNYDVKKVAIENQEGEGRTEYQYKTIVFDHMPTRNEVINRIIAETYPDGEESAIQRKGIINNSDPEFITYNDFVESTKIDVKQGFLEHETIQ